MNGKWKWQHTAKKVDIKGIFLIKQETYLTQDGFFLPQQG